MFVCCMHHRRVIVERLSDVCVRACVYVCVVGITDVSLLRGWLMFVCCMHHRQVIVERFGDVCVL